MRSYIRLVMELFVEWLCILLVLFIVLMWLYKPEPVQKYQYINTTVSTNPD